MDKNPLGSNVPVHRSVGLNFHSVLGKDATLNTAANNGLSSVNVTEDSAAFRYEDLSPAMDVALDDTVYLHYSIRVQLADDSHLARDDREISLTGRWA